MAAVKYNSNPDVIQRQLDSGAIYALRDDFSSLFTIPRPTEVTADCNALDAWRGVLVGNRRKEEKDH